MKCGLYNQAANQREDPVLAATVHSISIVYSLIVILIFLHVFKMTLVVLKKKKGNS